MSAFDIYKFELRMALAKGLTLRESRIAALAVAREPLPF